jgi:hypothetical protein
MKPVVFRLFALLAIGAGATACHHEGNQSGPGDAAVPIDAATATGPSLDFSLAGDGSVGPCATAVTCASAHANCGPISDGCGGLLSCGTCTGSDSCGGGGMPSVCGSSCVPKTCAGLGFNCGPAGDGCGGSLDCGSCMTPMTCGGSGTSSVCGDTITCTAKTCAGLGFNCGPAGDGCGGSLDCGSCTTPEVCGGGGTSSVCGKPACVPLTCASVGAATCGPIGDGCGGVIQCGGCSEPKTCGGLVASQCGIPPSCTNLCLKQMSCSVPAVTTTVSGIVYAPNGTDPLPNVLVFIPNAPVMPFAPGVACEQCSDTVSGSPLVSAVTDVNGAFTILNAPVGANIPLVVQTGRWRRQVVIPSVASCTNTVVSSALTRLPRNQGEGDIPLMAFVTGAVDSLECVMRKIGIDDAEFTQPSGTGRVRLYVGDGTQPGGHHYGGANAGTGTPLETALVDSPSTLAKYDMVLFACQGLPFDRTTTEQKNVINYANLGGRIFATHFNYTWLYDDAPFSSTADWDVSQCDPYTSTCFPPDQTGYIDTSFPKGLTLAQWLYNLGASTTLGQIAINTLRWDLNGVVAPAQSWMSINDSDIGVVPMHYTFNTPVGAAPTAQCGRVLFDDFHVENQGDTYNVVFPNECDNNPMTAQEKLLEFMIFDLGSCVTPDVPTCTPTTCMAEGIQCGPSGNGCGGALDCGPCPTGETCGGGGVPSICGAPSCTPKTCASQGISCGPAGDGCGGTLSCGTCTPPLTCGGGGTPGACGTGMCTPTTCMAQGIECGPAGNGCGGALDCGPCPTGSTCGGGGMPGICGSLCVPKTCLQLGYNCGAAGDGCGNALDCGTCSIPQTCGGGGTPNVCGGSAIQ